MSLEESAAAVELLGWFMARDMDHEDAIAVCVRSMVMLMGMVIDARAKDGVES